MSDPGSVDKHHIRLMRVVVINPSDAFGSGRSIPDPCMQPSREQPMNIELAERRIHPRIDMRRPCKIYDPRSRKFLPAVTRNVSKSGAMIDTPRLLEMPEDTTIRVAIARDPGQLLMFNDDMVDAVVIRSQHSAGGRTSLGLRFLASAQLEEPAPLAAA